MSELRGALGRYENDLRHPELLGPDIQLLIAAARSWLALLEGDEAAVERVATVICGIDNLTGPDVAVEGVPCDQHRSVARAAIAASVIHS